MVGCLLSLSPVLTNESPSLCLLTNQSPRSPGNLLDHGDCLLDAPDPGHPGEAVEIVLQRLDLLVQLQLGDDVADLGLGCQVHCSSVLAPRIVAVLVYGELWFVYMPRMAGGS